VSLPQTAEVVPLAPRRSPGRATLVALRARQWTKNLLLLAGIVFAAKLGDPSRWAEALAAFAAYCAASSAAYLANDVRDAVSDRLHPVKRRRPIARGELSPRSALTLAGALTAAAFVVTAALYGITMLAPPERRAYLYLPPKIDPWDILSDDPLLASLHAGLAWVPLGLALVALSDLGGSETIEVLQGAAQADVRLDEAGRPYAQLYLASCRFALVDDPDER